MNEKKGDQDLKLTIRKAKWIAKAKEFIFFNHTWDKALEIIRTKEYNKFPQLMGYPNRRIPKRNTKKGFITSLILRRKGRFRYSEEGSK